MNFVKKDTIESVEYVQRQFTFEKATILNPVLKTQSTYQALTANVTKSK